MNKPKTGEKIGEAIEVIQAKEDFLLQTYMFLLQKDLEEEINEFQIALSQAEAKDLWVTKTQWV